MVRDQRLTARELAVLVRNAYVIDVLSQVNRNFVNIAAFLASKIGKLVVGR